MSKYTDDGFIYMDTFEEIMTGLFNDRITDILKKKYCIDKSCIKTIEPIGIYEDSNIMKINVIFKDDYGHKQVKELQFKVALVEGERKRLFNFLDNSLLAYEEK